MAYWCHMVKRAGSTLVQVIACCLTAPSHYLNQCWLIMSEVLQHTPGGKFRNRCPRYLLVDMSLKMTNLSFQSNLPGAKELKWWSHAPICIISSVDIVVRLVLLTHETWAKWLPCCKQYFPVHTSWMKMVVSLYSNITQVYFYKSA